MKHLYEQFKNRKHVNLDISNKCTLECISCSRQTNRFAGKPVPGTDTSLQQFEKFCKYFDVITMCGQISDPIFNPNLIKFIELAKFHKKILTLHTAATVKNKKMDWYEKAFALGKNHVFWKFGIDGLPDTSPIYRVNQDSDFLFKVMVRGKEMGAHVQWQYIIFKYNEYQIEEAKKIAKEKKLNIQFKKSSRFTGIEFALPSEDNYVRKQNG